MAHIDTDRIQRVVNNLFNDDIPDFLRHSRERVSDGSHKVRDAIEDVISDFKRHKPQARHGQPHRVPARPRPAAPHHSSPAPVQHSRPPAVAQKSPHGFDKGTITLVNAYEKKDENTLGQGDRLRFKPAHLVNFDNTQSYSSLIAEVASHPAERVVVGNHGDDGRLFFYRDDGTSQSDPTLSYARKQLDACAARGWMPAELFITGCEGGNEIDPDQIKALSREYPGVTIVVSPTTNMVAYDGRGVYGEYYAFTDGHMKKSRYFDIDRADYGSKGNPDIVRGDGKDSDYQYWRSVYASEWREDGMMS